MLRSLLFGSVFVVAAACGGGTATGIADGGVGEDAASPTPTIPDGSVTKPDAGVDSATALDAGGLYFGACLSKLSAGRIDRVLRFYTVVKYTAVSPGGQAQISLAMTSLKLGPNNTAPPTVSKSETVGATYTATSPASANGVYAAPLQTITIPGAANPISGRDIVIEEAAVPGRFTPGKFCSQLSGHVVEPTDIQLEGDSNTCIYLPVKEGDPPPALQGADFPDTCALQ